MSSEGFDLEQIFKQEFEKLTPLEKLDYYLQEYLKITIVVSIGIGFLLGYYAAIV